LIEKKGSWLGLDEGMTLGAVEGVIDGAMEGISLGLDEGMTLGAVEGDKDGTMEGISERFLVDFVVSPALGLFVAPLGDLEIFNLRSGVSGVMGGIY
jgi:hypothetical protein